MFPFTIATDTSCTGAVATTSVRMLNDFYVFALTVAITWHHVSESRQLGRSGVAQVLLRDGKSIPISPPGVTEELNHCP